jgi:hypothetical protein
MANPAGAENVVAYYDQHMARVQGGVASTNAPADPSSGIRAGTSRDRFAYYAVPGLTNASPSNTRGRSRVLELGSL